MKKFAKTTWEFLLTMVLIVVFIALIPLALIWIGLIIIWETITGANRRDHSTT